jgi:serine/threonine-protein kinase
VRVDRVVAQAPSGDSQAERGQAVTLDVSSGPIQTVVPRVVDKTEDDARSALEAAGFRVTVVSKEDPDHDPGTVLLQNPGSGTSAPHGSVVTITVAEQPKQIAVPDVVGGTQNKATETLSGSDLKVVVKEAPADSPDGDGVVMAQSPDAGTKVDRGSTVTITVGVFDPSLNPEPGSTTTTTTPPATTTTVPPP